MAPSDPFEVTMPDSLITQQDSKQYVSLPQPSSYRTSSHVSTIAGALVSGAAIWQIGQAWSDGRIPVSWHALVAILVATLPTESVTSLVQGAIRAWSRRKG